ncbi:hypothetical protein G6F22_018056 [Rhizopus arrhizus]|nr:hypothetical protein G6F22_018056 [Rhizopus arrhizus]
MQGQQPREQRQAGRGGCQQPDGMALAQPQIREIAADDFGQRGQDEQRDGLQGAHVRALRLLRQQRAAFAFLLGNLLQGVFDVAALLLQRGAVLFQYAQVLAQLDFGVPRTVVHVDQGQDFGQLQPQALAAQRQFQARAVARAEDAVTPLARRADDPLVFIEADRAGRDVELAGEFRDGPG